MVLCMIQCRQVHLLTFLSIFSVILWHLLWSLLRCLQKHNNHYHHCNQTNTVSLQRKEGGTETIRIHVNERGGRPKVSPVFG